MISYQALILPFPPFTCLSNPSVHFLIFQSFIIKNRSFVQNKYKEAQHHKHFVVHPLVQGSYYIIKYIHYMPMHFINICLYQTIYLMVSPIANEFLNNVYIIIYKVNNGVYIYVKFIMVFFD